MEGMKSTTIIIATFCPNETRYELCAQSFAEIHQTGIDRKDYELIVFDNGGIQAHRDLIKGLEADVILSANRNIGQAKALNAGIAISKSTNLVLMDDDLSYEPGWLKTGLKILYRFPRYVVSLRECGERFITGDAGDGYKFARKVGGVWIMRRALYEKVGRFGMGYYSYGGLWTRNLIRKDSRFVVSDKPYITHLGRGKSIVGNDREKILVW